MSQSPKRKKLKHSIIKLNKELTSSSKIKQWLTSSPKKIAGDQLHEDVGIEKSKLESEKNPLNILEDTLEGSQINESIQPKTLQKDIKNITPSVDSTTKDKTELDNNDISLNVKTNLDNDTNSFEKKLNDFVSSEAEEPQEVEKSEANDLSDKDTNRQQDRTTKSGKNSIKVTNNEESAVNEKLDSKKCNGKRARSSKKFTESGKNNKITSWLITTPKKLKKDNIASEINSNDHIRSTGNDYSENKLQDKDKIDTPSNIKSSSNTSISREETASNPEKKVNKKYRFDKKVKKSRKCKKNTEHKDAHEKTLFYKRTSNKSDAGDKTSYDKYNMIKLPSFTEIMKDREILDRYNDKVNKAIDFIQKVEISTKIDSVLETVDDVTLGCELLTPLEIENYFKKFLPDMKNIIEGIEYNWRHEEFLKNDIYIMEKLNYNTSMVTFTHRQKDQLADLCTEHFDEYPIQDHHKYYFNVLLPELCLRIFMDVHDMGKDDAVSYLDKRPVDDIS